MKKKALSLRKIAHLAAYAGVGIVLATVLADGVSAQEIEPNDFVPAPAGTNIVLNYNVYAHNTDFNVDKGPTIKGSGLEVNLDIVRYVHFTNVGGFPAGFQILEAFGSESAGHIGTERLGSAFGATNLNLSAFIWPYANTETKQYLIVAGFFYPPTGTYDKNSAVNLAGGFGAVSYSGEAQLGWDQGIGEHFSYDLGADVRAYGDQTKPGGLRQAQDPDFRLQAFANWNWTRSFQTSIGWEGILGGKQYINHAYTGSTSQFERIRATAGYFFLPNAQALLELNHDVSAPGGFQQELGATLRVLFVF